MGEVGHVTRALELLRLASELEADLDALGRLSAECEAVVPSLASAPNDRAVAALVAVDLHGYYTGLEGAVERVERVIGALPPPGPSWRRDLLAGATRPLGSARPAVLSTMTASMLEPLLAFRHWFRHAYSMDLDASRLVDVAARLRVVHPAVVLDLRAFVTHLNDVARGLGVPGAS